MAGWETLVATLGGLCVGTGFGLLLGRRGHERLRQRVSRIQQRTRSTVVPALDRRADLLDIPRGERGGGSSDPLEIAISLAQSVLHAEEREELPFSDTVELSTGSLSASPSREEETR